MTPLHAYKAKSFLQVELLCFRISTRKDAWSPAQIMGKEAGLTSHAISRNNECPFGLDRAREAGDPTAAVLCEGTFAAQHALCFCNEEWRSSSLDGRLSLALYPFLSSLVPFRLPISPFPGESIMSNDEDRILRLASYGFYQHRSPLFIPRTKRDRNPEQRTHKDWLWKDGVSVSQGGLQ